MTMVLQVNLEHTNSKFNEGTSLRLAAGEPNHSHCVSHVWAARYLSIKRLGCPLPFKRLGCPLPFNEHKWTGRGLESRQNSGDLVFDTGIVTASAAARVAETVGGRSYPLASMYRLDRPGFISTHSKRTRLEGFSASYH